MQNTSGADQERKASQESREGVGKSIKRILLEDKGISGTKGKCFQIFV